jgi:HK97 family phage portal protein
MALRDFFVRSPEKPAPTSTASIHAQYAPAVMDQPFGTYWGSNTYGGFNNYANAILRQDAMSVPTVARCRNLLAGTIATIPLDTYDTKTGKEITNLVWVNQPDERQPRAVTIAWTVDSLLMYGVAYWKVVEVYKEDGRPARFEWVHNDRVSIKYNKWNTEVDYYTVNGERLPMNGLGSLVTFQALDQGLLLKSQSTIRAAIDIEKAAAIAAQTPMGSGFIKNNGADLPDGQVQGILAAWKQARQSRGTAYLTSTLEFQNISFNPKDMMYNEAKQYLATELSRACNVPAYLVDAETFRGMTYQNIIDGRKEFMAYSLAPFITAIEDRLSMDDLTPRGTRVRFAVDETFLRVDPLTRLQVTEKLLELNLISLDQAKEMEGLAPDGNDTYTPEV